MISEDSLNTVTQDSECDESGDFPSTFTSEYTHPPSISSSERPSGILPTLPGYEIIAELGRAGMGVVYKARQLEPDRIVAIKMLRDGVVAGAEHFERFYTEAQILSGLCHPNIVQIYEVGESENRLYMVLQYARMGSLADCLLHYRFSVEESVKVIEILARATHFVHQHGILHRDLKPANILLEFPKVSENTDQQSSVSEQILPMIADFGLGKRSATQQCTNTGAVLGTPGYMSPEQAHGQSRKVGVGTDVYSLGAILYEMLTGQPPFKGESVLETLDMVRNEKPRSLRTLESNISVELDAVCLKCLEKDPAQRYTSAEELAEELRCILQGKPLQHTNCNDEDDVERQKKIRQLVSQGLTKARENQLKSAALWFSEALRLEQQEDTDSDAEVILRSRLGTILQHCPRILHLWKFNSPVTRTAIAPEEDTGVLAHEDGTLRVVDLHTGQFTPMQDHHLGNINRVAYSQDGKMVISVSDDNTARVWDVKTGKALCQPLLHRQWVITGTFSQSGEEVVTTSSDGTVQVWDWREARSRFAPLSHRGMLWSAEFSPDGQWIVSAGWDGFAKVWNAHTGEPCPIGCQHSGWVRHASFSPNSQLLATASEDATVGVWHLKRRSLTTLPLRHSEAVREVRFTDDGRRLLSWTVSNHLHIWEVNTGRLLKSTKATHLLGGDERTGDLGRLGLLAMETGLLCVQDAASLPDEINIDVLDESAIRSQPEYSTITDYDESQPETWSADDLVLLSHCLTGKRIDAQGEPQTLSAELVERHWQELQQRHPAYFQYSQEIVQNWHQQAFDACRESGLLDLARVHLNKLIETNPQDDLRWAQRAHLHTVNGQWEQASQDYSQAIELNQEEPAYHLSRGIANTKLRHWEEAARDLKQLTLLQPDWTQGHYYLARAHIHLKNYQRAIYRLSKAIELEPQRAEFYVLRAGLHAQEGKWDSAVWDFQNARIHGDSRDIILALQCLLCLHLQLNNQSRELIIELIKRAEKNADIVTTVWALQLAVLFESGMKADWLLNLIEKIQSSDELSKTVEETVPTLHAAVLHRTGHDEEAVQVLQSIKPKTVWDWLWLARSYASLGDEQKKNEYYLLAQQWLISREAGESPLAWHRLLEIEILLKQM